MGFVIGDEESFGAGGGETAQMRSLRNRGHGYGPMAMNGIVGGFGRNVAMGQTGVQVAGQMDGQMPGLGPMGYGGIPNHFVGMDQSDQMRPYAQSTLDRLRRQSASTPLENPTYRLRLGDFRPEEDFCGHTGPDGFYSRPGYDRVTLLAEIARRRNLANSYAGLQRGLDPRQDPFAFYDRPRARVDFQSELRQPDHVRHRYDHRTDKPPFESSFPRGQGHGDVGRDVCPVHGMSDSSGRSPWDSYERLRPEDEQWLPQGR